MKEVPLKDIDYILLDLDGTLLDKYFDDYFWGHLVPEKYAEKKDMSFGRAQEELYHIYKSHEKTLKWTDLDFWSREFDLDIPALKEQLRHLIDVHPHVEHFLTEMKRMGKEVHLLTNAHWKSVKLKFKETGIGRHFDSVITSNEIGAPKEWPEFWEMAEKEAGFVPSRSLFVDDTEDVLHTARQYGIKYVVFKGRSSSMIDPAVSEHFLSITDFDDFFTEQD